MPQLPDQVNIDVMQCMLLPWYALGQDVIDKPSEVDILFILDHLLLFLLLLFEVSLIDLPILVVEDEILDKLQVLLEIVPPGIIALQLDLVYHFLGGLNQGQVFD